MITLTDKFIDMLDGNEGNPEVCRQAYQMVRNAPVTPESTGLLAYIYHEGIGVDVDLDKCFSLAEEAAFEGGDALGYYLLGYMCDNAETPDQSEGGPRQKYDHYDAERFYEKCAEIDSHWQESARLWLGDYYMNMAQGGDPEIGVEYYESIADDNAEAAGKLSDYYWDLTMPDYLDNEEWLAQLFKWTEVAAALDPEEYSYRMDWIYADGLGCEKNHDKAIEYFRNTYIYGDWRGTKSIADCFEEFISEHPELNEEEKAHYENKIKEWNSLAELLQENNLYNDSDEQDNAVEED